MLNDDCLLKIDKKEKHQTKSERDKENERMRMRIEWCGKKKEQQTNTQKEKKKAHHSAERNKWINWNKNQKNNQVCLGLVEKKNKVLDRYVVLLCSITYWNVSVFVVQIRTEEQKNGLGEVKERERKTERRRRRRKKLQKKHKQNKPSNHQNEHKRQCMVVITLCSYSWKQCRELKASTGNPANQANNNKQKCLSLMNRTVGWQTFSLCYFGWFCVEFVFGLVWFGLVWFGLVWIGLDWFDLVWLKRTEINNEQSVLRTFSSQHNKQHRKQRLSNFDESIKDDQVIHCMIHFSQEFCHVVVWWDEQKVKEVKKKMRSTKSKKSMH